MTNRLIILCGIPFSGKTTLAKQLAELKGYSHIDLDAVKVEVLGNGLSDEDIIQSQWDQVYTKMYQQIESELASGRTVVHDTGNFTVAERSLISAIASKLNLPFITVYVDAPTDAAYTRLQANRQNPSRFNISDQSFYAAVNEMEPPTINEHAVIYREGDNLSAWITHNLVK